MGEIQLPIYLAEEDPLRGLRRTMDPEKLCSNSIRGRDREELRGLRDNLQFSA